MNKLFWLLLSLFTSFVSQAVPVYFCTIDDIATYSQFPCGQSQTIIDVVEKQSSNIAPVASNSDELLRDVSTYQLDKKIERYQDKISLYKKRQNRELAELKLKSDQGNRHSTANNFHLEIKYEMDKVKENYNKKISALADKIVETQKEKNKV